jgi:maleate isomerase
MNIKISSDEDLMGWRARIGLLVPDALIPTEPWFYRLAPRGVTFLTTRMDFGKTATAETIVKLKETALRGAKELANAEVDIIGYCCTSGSFIGGKGYDQAIIEEIQNVTGIPTTTTTTACVEALKVLNFRSLVLVTPYVQAVDEIEKEFLEQHDFNVIGTGGKNLENVMEMAKLRAGEWYRLARDTYNKHPDADGIFISCMTVKPMDIIQPLENDTKRPVITADQATLWKLLRMAGINESIQGYGKLLSDY